MCNKAELPSAPEKKLLEQLRENPQLLERFESILSLTVEENAINIGTADEVESALIERLRLLGNEALTHWVYSAEKTFSEELKSNIPLV